MGMDNFGDDSQVVRALCYEREVSFLEEKRMKPASLPRRMANIKDNNIT
jgi:hypothetical protein